MDNNWIVENLTNAFGVWNSKMTEMWSLLTESPQTFKGGTIWQTIVTINGGMQAIGYGLLVLFFAIGIFRSASGYGRFFKIYMYAALSPVALASFAGEGTSHFGKAFLRSYVGVCMEGAVIVLACIIFSAFSSSGTPVVDSSASVVTQVWSYLGEVIFNLLVLVGLVKSADHIAKEMLGL